MDSPIRPLLEQSVKGSAWRALHCRLGQHLRLDPSQDLSTTTGRSIVFSASNQGTGIKDAPKAFSLKLRKTTKGSGLRPTPYDENFETSSKLLTNEHVDGIKMARAGETID
eukprot:8867897-Pyramimonas_sp.AAC.2